MKRFLMCLILILFFVGQVFSMPGTSKWEASWDVSTDVGLSGYNLYWRSSTEVYNDLRRVDCGLSTTQLLSGVVPDGSYITATCYDSSGNESDFCDEILFDVDSVAPGCLTGFCIKEVFEGK